MKLWLDDIRPAPEGWVWVKTVQEAIDMTTACVSIGWQVGDEFDECSLDHDLGQGDENDAIQFVDFMAENNIWPIKKPLVHSMNPAGRLRMERTIDRYFPVE